MIEISRDPTKRMTVTVLEYTKAALIYLLDRKKSKNPIAYPTTWMAIYHLYYG